MKRFLGRLMQMVGTLIDVSFLTFCLTWLAPGDPVSMLLEKADTVVYAELVEQTRHDLGLDQPFLVQYSAGKWQISPCGHILICKYYGVATNNHSFFSVLPGYGTGRCLDSFGLGSVNPGYMCQLPLMAVAEKGKVVFANS